MTRHRTALELRRRSVRFLHDGHNAYAQYEIRDPKNGARLQEELLFERERRAALMRSRVSSVPWPPPGPPKITDRPILERIGSCDVCGDQIDDHRGGMCELCIAAWRVVVREHAVARQDTPVQEALVIVPQYVKAPWE